MKETPNQKPEIHTLKKKKEGDRNRGGVMGFFYGSGRRETTLLPCISLHWGTIFIGLKERISMFRGEGETGRTPAARNKTKWENRFILY